jgi:hypothetical protein
MAIAIMHTRDGGTVTNQFWLLFVILLPKPATQGIAIRYNARVAGPYSLTTEKRDNFSFLASILFLEVRYDDTEAHG